MDDQQRARELLAQEWRKISEDAPADMLVAGCELPPLVAASIAAITAALRAEPDELAERHAAAERDACRWARIAEEHRDGRLAALERVAELEAKLRAAPEGFVMVPVVPTREMLKEIHLIDAFTYEALCKRYAAMLAARPQGVKG